MPLSPGPSPSADHAPSDPLAAVRGRILLHVKGTANAPLDRVSAESGGAVFSGKRAQEKAKEFLTRRGPGCPVVLDPSAYEDFHATAEEPFTLERQLRIGTRRTGVGATLEHLASDPVDLVLTPTRYLWCDDAGERALDEAVRQVNAADVPDVVFAAPVDARWLTDRREHLVAALRSVRAPGALILGDSGNPVGSKTRARALREVLRACPGTALLRTDLAALDAMAHGAAFASIGDTASVRHAVPPGKQGGIPGPRTSPDVIMPELMGYFHGATLAERLRNSRPCDCLPCVEWGEARNNGEVGRPLSGFQDTSDTAGAHAHNMAVWSRWWRQLCSERSQEDVREQWRGMCRRAHLAHEWHNRAISPRQDTFTASDALRYWAEDGDEGSRSSTAR